MNMLSRAFAICGAMLVASLGVCAEEIAPQFVVSADKLSFRPTTTFHSGDRIQVSSPHIDVDDILSLQRCSDDCKKIEVIRTWGGRYDNKRGGLSVSEFVTLQKDGDYFFAANRIPNNLPDVERQGCNRAVLINELCVSAKPLAITDTKPDPTAFRARFSTDSWIWVRIVRRGDG